MDIEIKISNEPVEYKKALEFMEARVDNIISGKEPEMLWFLEHPPLYTAGTSAKESDLIDKDKFPVFEAGRGGEYTYHGPGQRVIYVMLNLKKRYQQPDLKKYVNNLEKWIIYSLEPLGIKGEIRKGRIGIWVEEDEKEAKIAALGIRVRKWVTYHGISLNINPDLSHFKGIIPCGIKEFGVTSLEKLKANTDKNRIDKILIDKFNTIF